MSPSRNGWLHMGHGPKVSGCGEGLRRGFGMPPVYKRFGLREGNRLRVRFEGQGRGGVAEKSRSRAITSGRK